MEKRAHHFAAGVEAGIFVHEVLRICARSFTRTPTTITSQVATEGSIHRPRPLVCAFKKFAPRFTRRSDGSVNQPLITIGDLEIVEMSKRARTAVVGILWDNCARLYKLSSG